MLAELDELRNEIRLDAAGSSSFEVAAFASVFARHLEEAEQVFDVNVEVLQCRGPRGKRLELLGYAEDTTSDCLVLLAGKYFGADQTLTLSDARDAFSRATGFVEASASGWLAENLEMSSREAEYAEYFSRQIAQGKYGRLRVILVTDGVMSDRIRTVESDDVVGIRASYEIWDSRRILDAALPEKRSEDIRVDFTKWFPHGLPCLVADVPESEMATYLAVIPGRVLAEVFDEHGALLLESNVRTFLSARGAVNKGIQATLAQEPEKFLAYNNGLTTTAAAVDLTSTGGVPAIRTIERWQIVNGGQTTASLAHFLRSGRGRSLEDVHVQMKLVAVGDAESDEMVQSIAKYANSQNRISGADLFSTHKFHVRLEQISRRLRAPAREGEQYATGWYYERARGQWENDRAAHFSTAEKKKFELEYPKMQRITKTDWAKYAYCWGKKPHLVSKGAQSVFAEYANAVDAQWEKDDSAFSDGYFRTNVAKAIMYNELRAAVMKQEWYKASPGYLANIVAYAISGFASQLESQFAGERLDFERVWRAQRLGEQTLGALVGVARAAQAHLTDEGRPQANVTQWAKQQACWDRFSKSTPALPVSLAGDLVSAGESATRVAEDRRQRDMDSGFEAIELVLAVPTDTWRVVRAAGVRVGLSPTESDLVDKFGLRAGGVPTERQAAVLIRVLKRMQDAGEISRDAVR